MIQIKQDKGSFLANPAKENIATHYSQGISP
jgi:hypothetical protein